MEREGEEGYKAGLSDSAQYLGSAETPSAYALIPTWT